jgi:hypothetical protein
MADPLLNSSSVLVCSHGGRCVPAAVSPRVKVSSAPCLLVGSPMPIAGCTAGLNQGGPCTTAQVLSGTLRVRSMGQPLLTLTSALLAMPPGLPVIIANPGQSRVTGV